MTTLDAQSESLSRRLLDGLERVSSVLRADQWLVAQAAGINPTQLSVLTYLAGRGRAAIKVKDISSHLGVSQPTVTDCLVALERKLFAVKAPSTSDSRALSVKITVKGRSALKTVIATSTRTETALSGLSPSEQASLLLLIVKLIRSMQMSGAIAPQRMCVSCSHFRPNHHPGAEQPHRCAFVNAAFGNWDIRVDCGDHATVGPAAQTAIWSAFNQVPANLQAN